MNFNEQIQQIEQGTPYKSMFCDWFCTRKQLEKQGKTNLSRTKYLLETWGIDLGKVKVYFKNNFPVEGDLYDRIYIENIDNQEQYMTVTPRYGHKGENYTKCEVWFHTTNEEIYFDNWLTFKKKASTMKEQVRERLGL